MGLKIPALDSCPEAAADWLVRRAEALERVRGIEPLYEAWEAAVLPLNYTRSALKFTR